MPYLLRKTGADNHLKKTSILCKKIAKSFVKVSRATGVNATSPQAKSRTWRGICLDLPAVLTFVKDKLKHADSRLVCVDFSGIIHFFSFLLSQRVQTVLADMASQ
jgi:hypothetical protein